MLTTDRPDYLGRRFYYISEALEQQYGMRLEKLMLDGGFTCPNRDGTLGYGGCIFCSGGGSGEFAGDRNKSITEQIKEQLLLRQKNGREAAGYIAYFQAFTGTYAPVSRLEALYREALRYPDVKVLSVATRPDCLSEEVLDLLDEINREKHVWVELGLQTMHKSTADYIRRGYELSVFERAVGELHRRGIKVIVHLILGLPGEDEKMLMQTVRYLNSLPIWGVKLQLLHILRGSGLEEPYISGKISTLSMDEYVSLVCSCIGNLRPDIVIHRLTGDGASDDLLAPDWSRQKRKVLNQINHMLKEKDIRQGDYWFKAENKED